MDPVTILAAFGPLLIDAGKALVQKFLAPDEFKPTKIEDYVRMRELDLQMFKAMNEAGGTNPSYPWAEAIVRLMRPGFAAVIVSVWAIVHLQRLHGVELDTSTVDNMASAVGFYLFGDRSLFYSKKTWAQLSKTRQ